MSGSLAFFTVLGLGGTDTQFLSVSGATSDDLSSNMALTNINELTRYTSSVCETNCTQTISNTTVIISPGAQVGPVTFTQQCTVTDVNCAINSLIDASLESTLREMQLALANGTYDVNSLVSYGITPEMIKSPEDLDVILKNNMYQMISSQCTFETNQTMNNNYVFIGSGASTGAISFSQTANLTTIDCAIDVISKNSTYNQETAQPEKPSNNLMTFFLLIMLVIIILTVIVVIVFLVAGGDETVSSFFKGEPPLQLESDVYSQADKQTYLPVYEDSSSFI